ncbi:probable E3 ubiquitin-protein ligase HIP1 isoform X2 [Malania oleifera]|uniref:probable E3 ubiquitin-protein ligase HIP1 isoform X2 n=1 Tax=Malania oleifera TaxID=397392 RepID=UPI0025ADC9C6|nr:probable E3 ubiquitin-protein ligase HIP1 isoform X2 [Malania oleifera]
MDHTSEPTSQSTEEEDCHSVSLPPSRSILVARRSNQVCAPATIQSSPSLIIPRPPHPLSRGSMTRGIHESSDITLSCVIEQIRSICVGIENLSNRGACPRPPVSRILRRHLPQSQAHRGLPHALPSTVLTTGSAPRTTAGSPHHRIRALTNSDENRAQNEDDISLMMHQHEETILYMLRILNNLLEGSLSVLISQADNGVNFRVVSEEHNIPFNSQSLMVQLTERYDHYRGMRLDVDNMSYEELLALEDRIGYVSTGLTEEAVTKSLKHSKYFLFAEENAEKESCAVCQEDYVEEDELGTLDCGHAFHTACIIQWLRCKNQCPICKSTGLCTLLQAHHNL